MPLQPVTNTLHLPVNTEQDVRAVFEAGLQIPNEPSRSRRGWLARDLEDYFFYIGAVLPDYVTALQPEFTGLNDTQITHFDFRFNTWLYLMQGAADTCVQALRAAFDVQSAACLWLDAPTLPPGADPQQVRAACIRREMLAAIGTPAALTALAELSHQYGWARYLNHLGFEVPAPPAPAIARFTPWRRAICAVLFEGTEADWSRQPHPIGLPLSTVVTPESERVIGWHYLSVATDQLSSMPSLNVERLHLVSAYQDCCWTLHIAIQADGRYAEPIVEYDDDDEDEELTMRMREHALLAEQERQVALLLPFDDRLIYCNGHVNMTEGVYGQVGGPPLGLYMPPSCRRCGRLMFHVLTVEARIHHYGDAWRSLYICETCRTAATQATSWN